MMWREYFQGVEMGIKTGWISVMVLALCAGVYVSDKGLVESGLAGILGFAIGTLRLRVS